MDIFHWIPIPDFWAQYLPDQDTNISTCMHFIYILQYTGFVTAVNEPEFCKALKSKLGQDSDTTIDI